MLARALLMTIVLALGTPASAAAFRNVAIGAPAPALALEAGGAPVAVPASGRVTVVLFWRSGQAFSEEAMADLSTLAPALTRKGVVVVAIAEIDADATPSGRLPRGAIVDRNRQAADAFGVIVFPSTAVIDARGALRAYVPSRRAGYRAIVEAHVLHALGEIPETDLARRLGEVGEIHGRNAEAAEAAFKRGTSAAAERRHEEAAIEFARAIALQPDLVNAHLQLGYVRLETNEPQQALKEFEFVLGASPGSPGARVGLGIVRIRLGQVDEGIRLIEDAVLLNPEPVRGHYELARAYEARGDVKRAVYHYRWAFLKLLQGRK
ncbi:MAG: tetratricopeptide repeat protein [Candidatus Rokubacteria bacterium]|nr:tetratricopeptide repeat protein [Candidatus Rokubacteria bacterium]